MDLEIFPGSKVRQLAKRMKSSKAAVCHIKQVAGDPQTAQMNLMRHQHTELSSGKHKKKMAFVKSRQPSHKNAINRNPQVSNHHKKSFDPRNVHKNRERCSKCGNSTQVEGFQFPAKKFQCKACHKFARFTNLCYQMKQAPFKSRRPKAHQLQAGALYAHENAICHQSGESSSDDSFCLQLKVQCTPASLKKIPTPSHLITNLAYRLKPHHTRNKYLRERLDTCADVNITPTSVYRLVFKDQELKKLAPSTMEIGPYTTDTVKTVGSCVFYLVHLDTKK